ncbi:hypothetical protein R4Z10_16605 [Niallia sp. XMNu-256]|uniref:hypothetical protein n=1 Tax=Niallia sp. XMNu-256 TaxID=3082444 RepID=UPI0030CB5124
MTRWLEENKNTVLIIVLLLFMILALFFFFVIRPLAAEEEAKEQELNRIQSDVSFYQGHLNELTPQTFTAQEKEVLLGKVPANPSVEDVIKELEKSEIETGAVIDHISISDHPNGLAPIAVEPIENNDSQSIGETQESTESNPETVQQPETNGWLHILPEETLKRLEEQEKLEEVKALSVSYVEFAIDVNGEVEDVHQYLEAIETFKRIIHIQSFDYSINEENGRLEGVITIRAFYSKEFEQFINEDSVFELDYDFAPSKINRYIEPIVSVVESDVINGGENPLPQVEAEKDIPHEDEENFTSKDSESSPPKENESSTEKGNGLDFPNRGNNSNAEEKRSSASEKKEQEKEQENNTSEDKGKNLAEIDPKNKVYSAPESKREGEPLFLVVQTGAYATTNSVNLVAQDLVEAGIYPRIIGDELFYIYTATDSSMDSAQKIVEMLKNKGFDSYVKTLPYRLTEAEKELFLKEADNLVSTTTEILTNHITKNDRSITEEQLNTVQSKIKTFESKVQESIVKDVSEERKKELQDSVLILHRLDQRLQNSVNDDGSLESLWEAEGLLLDFMLILNRYVPADLT